MDSRSLPLNALRVFEAVGRLRSFTAGAAALNIAQSACSRHVSRLEEVVGRRLFTRTGNRTQLTEAGVQLLPIVQNALGNLANGIEMLQAETELRLHIPPTFVQTVGRPFIQQFKSAHETPGITIYSTLSTGIPDGDYDVAIVFDRTAKYTDGRVLLWPITMTPICSAADAGRVKRMGLSAALKREDILHVSLEGHPHDYLWRKFATTHRIKDFRHSTLAFDTAALAIEFARAGAGLALADTYMLRRDLSAEGLAAPFNKTFDTGFGYYLIMSPGQPRTGVLMLKRHIAQLASGA